MRLREFQRACAEEFGDDYAGVVIRDHWLTALGSTGRDALDAGVPARQVWEALCDEFEVPASRRHGRGLRDPQG